MGREEIIAYCMTFKNTYKDNPFRDEKQMTVNHKGNRKVFAWFYEDRGKEYVRFRCHRKSGEKWAQMFSHCHVGFTYEEVCWIEVAMEEELLTHEMIKNLAGESYELTKPEKRRESYDWHFG